MTVLRRGLAVAAALNATVLVGAATAQTVIVTKAPAGATVELVLNGAMIASMTASPTGEATLPVNLEAHGGRSEMDARIYLDVCPGARRVLLVERGLEPPANSGCSRKDLISLFLLRPVTTIVVDATESNPDVWLRQGPAPASWLTQGPEDEAARPGRVRQPAPTGLMLFGGGGSGMFGTTRTRACGDVATCGDNRMRLTYAAGAAYWITSFLGVEGSYVRPADLVVSGSGDAYRFTSSLDARVFTIVGKLGASAGPVRLYGQGGANYQKSTFSTTQTVDAKTITVDGVEQTVPGGTQTLGWKTDGWGWLFGGGAEIWVNRRFAIYAEGGRVRLKGSDINGGQGKLDDHMTYALAGARLRLRR